MMPLKVQNKLLVVPQIKHHVRRKIQKSSFFLSISIRLEQGEKLKRQASDAAEQAKRSASEAGERVKSAAQNAKSQVESQSETLVDKVFHVLNDVKDSVLGKIEKFKSI